MTHTNPTFETVNRAYLTHLFDLHTFFYERKVNRITKKLRIVFLKHLLSIPLILARRVFK